MEKYLLSTGKSTYRLEQYILDQFKVYLTVHPGDIPGLPTLGFNFTLVNVLKSNLQSELYRRVSNLIDRVQNSYEGNVLIGIESLEILSEDRANLVLTVSVGDQSVTDDIDLNLNN